MSEYEWLTTCEIGDMISHLFDNERFSKRKMRLVSIAAWRKYSVNLL